MMHKTGHMLQRLGLGVGLGLVLIALATCSIDQGIEPQIGVPAIRGTITFEGNPPANTHWVVVVASRDFPPSDVVQLALSQSARLDFNAGSADYEIKVPSLGSYAAIAVVWKARDEPVIWSDVLGLYGASFTGGISFPDTVHVTGDAPVVDDIDVTADFTAVDRGAVLGGRITYDGNWPDNTELMGIAAYRTRPANLLEFFQPAASISLCQHRSIYSTTAWPHLPARMAIPSFCGWAEAPAFSISSRSGSTKRVRDQVNLPRSLSHSVIPCAMWTSTST